MLKLWLLFFWRTGRVNRKENACGYIPGKERSQPRRIKRPT
ncbi:hypothetical protein E2C01_085487 [Portunus trituberculatus]|uniref:Uncharacterized protein n=1 Tax=Portunus trituberculatus TaxID=210409 RepID=A0A5B7JC24_PORTR|nr:hypothetical protein [Portunus trituberculatus]